MKTMDIEINLKTEKARERRTIKVSIRELSINEQIKKD